MENGNLNFEEVSKIFKKIKNVDDFENVDDVNWEKLKDFFMEILEWKI